MDWTTGVGGVVTSVTDVVQDIFPIVLPLLALFIGVALVPKLVKRFTK